MKLLILSSNIGGGHAMVASAIREYFENHGHTVEVRDGISFISKTGADLFAFSHKFIYRHAPGAFSALYSEDNRVMTMREGTASRELVDHGAKRLAEFIREGCFDAVICTHIIPAIMLSTAKQAYALGMRTAFVETDYTLALGSVNHSLDFHFVPHESLIRELVKYGIRADRIIVSGIPVRSAIRANIDRAQAREQFAVADGKKHVVIAGGSMGAGPIEELAGRLSGRLDDRGIISIICGSNSHLEKEMTEQFRDMTNIRMHGFVGAKEIAALYASADVFVTKAGGISTTEAAVIGLPMVLINAVAGCESFNLAFFLNHEAALSGENDSELADRVMELLADEKRRAALSGKLHDLSVPDSVGIIYRTITA